MSIKRAKIDADGLKIWYEDRSWVKVSEDMVLEKTPGSPATERSLEEGEMDAWLEAIADREAEVDVDSKDIRFIAVEDGETLIVYTDGTREKLEGEEYKLRDPDTGFMLKRPATEDDIARIEALVSDNPDLVREDDDADEDEDETEEDDDLEVVRGTDDDDDIEGGRDDEDVRGGEGDDVMDGRGGNDDMHGGRGNDEMSGGRGSDEITGGEGDDMLDGGRGKDWVYGGAGNDTVTGGNGRDRLFGEDGDDTLIGGRGKDRLEDGAGMDTMTGGRGVDTFVFVTDGAAETITDFNTNKDRVNLLDAETPEMADFSETEEGLLLDLGEGDTILFLGLGMDDADSIAFV